MSRDWEAHVLQLGSAAEQDPNRRSVTVPNARIGEGDQRKLQAQLLNRFEVFTQGSYANLYKRASGRQCRYLCSLHR